MGVSALFPLEMLSATEVSTLRCLFEGLCLFVSGLSYPVMPCTANTQNRCLDLFHLDI